MNEFNVLLAAATNGTPSGSLFDALFARYIAPQESWCVLESPLPITILSAGEDLIDYRIYGNTENGESVGERTENLFDYNATDANNGYVSNSFISADGEITSTASWFVSEYIRIHDATNYFLKIDTGGFNDRGIVFYNSNQDYISGINYRYGIADLPFSTPSNAEFVRICGLTSVMRRIMLVESSTAPTSYIPYGYKLPMVVRSENLLNQDANGWQRGFYIRPTGDTVYNGFFDASPYIEIEPGTVYTLVCPNAGSGVYNAFYDVNKIFISSFEAFGQQLHTATSPPNAKYIRCSVISLKRYPELARSAMLVEGDTEPPAYIPYYRDEESIYIGSDPLAEDEYVDFGEQKIYRMVNGTLTPTDPPVPIPALPTIRGETIIDYNPSEIPAVEPEKMYIKYKPQ